MPEARPLKLTNTGDGTGRLEEFADGDSLPVALLPDIPANKVEGLQGLIGASLTPTKIPSFPATPISASAAVSGYPASNLNNSPVRVLGSAITGGWLAPLATTPPYIEVALPFGVVIGDSIAEGHPTTHGRLHPDGSAGFTQNYVSTAGQISFELSRMTGSHWYNHGIGSETSTQVAARFDRDVLGLTSNPGDGRGDKTLPGKPYIAVVVVGANDVGLGAAAATIQANMLAMLAKMKAANIIPVFTTVAPATSYTAAQRAVALAVNQWMLSTFAGMGAIVFDLYAWGSDGADGLKPWLYVDNVHPSRAGYVQLATDLFTALPVSVCSATLRLDFKVAPGAQPASWAQPTKVQVSREGVTLDGIVVGDWVIFSLTSLPALQSPVARITLAAPSAGNAGISGAHVQMAATRPAASVAGGSGGLSVSGVLSKNGTGVWMFDPSFAQRGVHSVSANTSEVVVTCDPCSMVMTGLVGSLVILNKLKVSASWGVYPVTSFSLKFGDGAVQVDPTTTSVPNGTYYSIIGPAV